MKTNLSLVTLILVSACGSSYKTYHVPDDMLPHATMAATRFNELLGCDLVTVIGGDEAPALRNHVQEIFFSSNMHRTFAGFTHLEDEAETDIMVRPKDQPEHLHLAPPDYVGTIVHELGHAYGLEHVPTPDIMNLGGGDWRDADTMERFKTALERQGVRCSR